MRSTSQPPLFTCGSTVADQTNVPEQVCRRVLTSLRTMLFLAGANPQYPGGLGGSVLVWGKEIGAAYSAAKLIYDAAHQANASPSSTYPPIPFFVELNNDVYDLYSAERQRTFWIKDIYGHFWNASYPIRIREQFSDMTTVNGASGPSPTGVWYNNLPALTANDEKMDQVDLDNTHKTVEFTDHHHGSVLLLGSQVNYLQYYYTTDFPLPAASLIPDTLFSVPGFSGPAMPLWIKDTTNKCASTTSSPAEAITEVMTSNGQIVSINGDKGAGTVVSNGQIVSTNGVNGVGVGCRQ